jgi:hypothetical protein
MFSTPIRFPLHASLRATLLQWMRDIIAGGFDGLAIQDRYEVLSRLTASELSRCGVTRADIPRLAVNGGTRYGGHSRAARAMPKPGNR